VIEYPVSNFLFYPSNATTEVKISLYREKVTLVSLSSNVYIALEFITRILIDDIEVYEHCIFLNQLGNQ
jgi:hypothetical protein